MPHGRLRDLDSAALLDLFFDRHPLPSWLEDSASGRILVANQAAVDLYGYSREEFAALGVGDLRVAEEPGRSGGESVASDRSEAGIREVHRKRDGSRFVVEHSARGVSVGGRALRLALLRDLSPHVAAEEATRASLALLRATLESTADGILVVDAAGRILSSNRRFAEMWRIPAAILDGRDDGTALRFVLSQLVEPAEFERKVRELYAAPLAESFDVLHFLDGRVFERLSIPLIQEGRPAGRVWSFRDATERLRTAEALTASEQRYRTLFERNVAGLYRNAVDGEILECNDAYARILGFGSRWELVGRNAFELFFDPAARDEAIAELRARRSFSDRELCLRRRDGSPVWVSAASSIGSDGGREFIEGMLVDISRRKEAERQILHHAYHDALTGLLNRTGFLERLGEVLEVAAEGGQRVGLLFLDLDQFKRVNDTLGHTAGDRLLQKLSDRLRRVAGEGDTIARVGGDEFIVMTPGPYDARPVEALAQRVLRAIEEPLELGGRRLFVTASIGISLFPTDGLDAESLLTGADVAMYRAKELGRNGYQLCDPELSARVFAQLTLESELRLALERHEFELFFQPQLAIAGGHVVGFEALLRWRHPERGLVAPDQFVGAAESSFLIDALGRWVLLAACRRAATWSDPRVRVAVNLSPRQLLRGDLLTIVDAILVDSGLEPSRLDLEITESAAVADLEASARLLGALRERGVRIAIDDFGTGHASLAYLSRLPIDALKIDRGFVHGIGRMRASEAIVTSVVELAHGIGLQVVAEGVETEAQFEFLAERGCDVYQGYLAAAPLPGDAAERWLRDGWLCGTIDAEES